MGAPRILARLDEGLRCYGGHIGFEVCPTASLDLS
jgi:predicted acetyltransferase